MYRMWPVAPRYYMAIALPAVSILSKTGAFVRSSCMALLVASACLLSFGQNQPHEHVGPKAQVGVYVPVHKFDPKRDAAADIEAAIHEAQRTGKRILLDVGGD